MCSMPVYMTFSCAHRINVFHQGVIEMFWVQHVCWLNWTSINSWFTPHPVRYYFKLDNFLNSPKIDLTLKFFLWYFIEDLISCKAWNTITIMLLTLWFMHFIDVYISFSLYIIAKLSLIFTRFFLNFYFFFYFEHPFLIKIQFKFEFQFNRLSKIINIIFFWLIFCPAIPQHTCLKIKKITPWFHRVFFFVCYLFVFATHSVN